MQDGVVVGINGHIVHLKTTVNETKLDKVVCRNDGDQDKAHDRTEPCCRYNRRKCNFVIVGVHRCLSQIYIDVEDDISCFVITISSI